uniref:R3H domain-containing protein 4 n=1 Tax=Myxine glutinosa TaxID=7769 RepID=UPI00358FE822
MVKADNFEEEEDDIVQKYIISENVSVSHCPRSPNKKTLSSCRKQHYINQAVRNSDLVRQGKGRQRQRRQENTRFLLELLGREGFSTDGEDIEMHETQAPSIFAEVLTKKAYVQVWNEFMNCSGEEQERLLQNIELRTQGQTRGAPGDVGCHEVATDAAAEQVPGTGSNADNKVFSPGTCFQRIDRRLRSVLRRNHIPLGTLENLEDNVRSFFSEFPAAIYLAMLESSFDRLLLHALCQYLDLASSSRTLAGKRETRVKNRRDVFQPPCVALHSFLENLC